MDQEPQYLDLLLVLPIELHNRHLKNFFIHRYQIFQSSKFFFWICIKVKIVILSIFIRYWRNSVAFSGINILLLLLRLFYYYYYYYYYLILQTVLQNIVPQIGNSHYLISPISLVEVLPISLSKFHLEWKKYYFREKHFYIMNFV